MRLTDLSYGMHEANKQQKNHCTEQEILFNILWEPIMGI